MSGEAENIPKYVEPGQLDIDDRYINGVQNLAFASQQSKINKIEKWRSTDKLINDFFTFSLITLGLMATILAAKQQDINIIASQPLFYTALVLQAFEVIFSSVVRLYINDHSSETADKVFQELINRINKIDILRIAVTNTNLDEKTKAEADVKSSFAPEYEFTPQDNNWILKNSQKVVVIVFVIGFFLFISSLVLNINIKN